jgi:hypothetical protein
MNRPAFPTRPGWARWLLHSGILAGSLLVAAGAAGCYRGDDAAAPAFLPGWTEARQALESALAAWRDAPAPLPASFDPPGVIFVDKQRRPEQRLLSFEVLGQAAVENARQFTVRLRLELDGSPRLVRYYALGRNPVWVLRLEDYERICHWEHDMTEPVPGPDAARP